MYDNFNPYETLKSLLQATISHTGKDFIKATANEFKKLFDADLVFITKALDFSPSTKLEIIYSTDKKVPKIINIKDTPAKYVFKKKVIKITKDVQYNFDCCFSQKLQSFFGVPIINDRDICIGHIAIYSKKVREFPNELKDMVLIYSKRLEIEIKKIEQEKENKKVRKELENLTITDTLTTLYNRRYFEKICSNIFARVKRDATTANLAYIDIDDFKNINDTYGHDAGDFVLKTFADILKEQTREGVDYIFRLGGEEFCIISLDTPLNFSFKHLARIMLKTIEKFKSTKYGEITLSVGLVPFKKEYNSYEDILKLADQKMYHAKKAGKNTIVK